MTIGVLTVNIYVDVQETIKEQRNRTRSIREKLRNKFNVSVAEIPEEGMRGRSSIAVVAVNSDAKYVQTVLSNVYNHLDRLFPDIIQEYHIETLLYQA